MERVGGTPPTASVSQGKPSGPAGGGFVVEDQVDLSESARLFLANGDHAFGPGKSMNSAAHKARAVIAENPHLAGMPFGQVVSQLNHGTLDLTPPAAPGDGAEAASVADPGEVSGIPAADGEATATVAGEGDGSAFTATAEDDTETVMDGDGAPIIQPLPEDGAEAAVTADGVPETLETELAEAGPEADAGDDAASDGAVVTDTEGPTLPVEPVVAVDTTASLLDLLDGSDGSETEQAA